MKKALLIILSTAVIMTAASQLFVLNQNDSFAGSAKEQFEKSLKTTGAGAGYKTEGGDTILAFRIGHALSYVLTFLGVAFLGLTIYGGYIWMAARGNEQQVEKAKETLKNVVIGLIIIVAAYAVTFWISEAVGKNLIRENIYEY